MGAPLSEKMARKGVECRDVDHNAEGDGSLLKMAFSLTAAGRSDEPMKRELAIESWAEIWRSVIGSVLGRKSLTACGRLGWLESLRGGEQVETVRPKVSGE